jgi:hypothetical protein
MGEQYQQVAFIHHGIKIICRSKLDWIIRPVKAALQEPQDVLIPDLLGQ